MGQHIEPLRFKEKLTKEELEHLASCRFCREAFAGYVEEHELLTAPADLKPLIMERCRRPDVQIAAGANHLSGKLQLLFFSLKVSAAVLGVLTLLAIAPDFTKQMQIRVAQTEYSAQPPAGPEWNYYEKVSSLTEQLTGLSRKNMEVFNYDKKEK